MTLDVDLLELQRREELARFAAVEGAPAVDLVPTLDPLVGAGAARPGR